MPCRIILNNNKVPAKVIPPFILRISLFFFRKRQVPFVNKRVDVAKYVRNKTCKCCKLLFECRQSNCFSIRVMKGMQWRGVAVCLQNEEWWPTHRQLLLVLVRLWLASCMNRTTSLHRHPPGAKIYLELFVA